MVLFLGTSLSRNFFTDLSRGIVDMPKPRLQPQIANLQTTFLHFLFLKKAWRRDLNPTVKGHSPISLTCSVDFFTIRSTISLLL